MIMFIYMRYMKKFVLSTIALTAVSSLAQTANPQVQQNAPAEEVLMDLSVDSSYYAPAAQPPVEQAVAPIAGDSSGLFIPEPTPAAQGTAPVEYANPAATPESVEANGFEAAYDPVPATTTDSIAFTLPTTMAPEAQPATTVAIEPLTPEPQAEEVPIWATPIQSDEPFTESAPAEPVDPRITSQEAHALDILHGNAYNTVGNEAAAPTVKSETSLPHKMYGRKFAYAEPVDSYGALSFGESTTYFMVFSNNSAYSSYSNIGLVTLGFATKSFGLSIDASVGKSWEYTDDDITGAETTQKYTAPGSLIGATFSTSLLDLDLGLNVTYADMHGSYFTNADNAEEERDAWDLSADLVVANPNGSLFSWNFTLHFYRTHTLYSNKSQSLREENGKTYITTYTTTETDTTSRIEVVPEINLGAAVLKNEKARIFLGLNTLIPFIAYDRIQGVVSRHNEYGLIFTPNILAEVSFNKYIMAYGCVSYKWDALWYRDSDIKNTSLESILTQTETTSAVLGVRFQYEFAALEMAFTKQFLQNPFGSFSDHEAVAMSLGAFVNF